MQVVEVRSVESVEVVRFSASLLARRSVEVCGSLEGGKPQRGSLEGDAQSKGHESLELRGSLEVHGSLERLLRESLGRRGLRESLESL